MARRRTYEKEYDALQQEVVDRGLCPTAVTSEWGKNGPWKFDDIRKAKFLEHYALSGQLTNSAAKVGVSRYWIYCCRKKDKAFALAVEEAKLIYCDILEEEIHRRAVKGVKTPIIGGRNRDEVVVWVQKYSDSLLALKAKRHIPEYREKFIAADEGTGGGVLVVERKPSESDWVERFGGEVE